MLTCNVCEEPLEEKQAVVPALRFLTEDGTIALKNVNLAANAYCRRCAGMASKGYPEAKFHYFEASRKLITRLLEKEKARTERFATIVAEQEVFRQIAHGEAACVSGQALLPTVEIKAKDKNGYDLKGAARTAVLRKGLKPILLAQERADAERKSAKATRREREKAARELKARRAEQNLTQLRAV